MARDLGRKEIPDPVWEDVVRQRYLSELLQGDGDDATLYRGLKNRVREVLDMIRRVRRHSPSWSFNTPTIDSAFTEYVQGMTKVLHEPEDGPYGKFYPDAIRGTFRSGVIRVDAEPWVPANAIERFYREMQLLVLRDRRNESVQVSTLKRYYWVRERRRTTKESWAKTRKAWEAGTGRDYPSTRQFSRDFHRTKRFISRIRELHDEALRLEEELEFHPRNSPV